MEANASFERAMGRTLEANRIDIADAKTTPSGPAYALIPGTSVNGRLIDRSPLQNRFQTPGAGN